MGELIDMEKYKKDKEEKIRLIEEQKIEQEYNEFLELLSYFLNVSAPLVKGVVTVSEHKNGYYLYDDNGNIIETDYLDENILDDLGYEMQYEDLLISALVSIAPERLNISKLEGEIVDTLEKIFGDKIVR